MNVNKNDWRLRNQEAYLKGVKLKRKKYKKFRENWEHDHCDFCQKKFSEDGENTLKEGYVTMDNYHWICCTCFNDFGDLFNFVVTN